MHSVAINKNEKKSDFTLTTRTATCDPYNTVISECHVDERDCACANNTKGTSPTKGCCWRPIHSTIHQQRTVQILSFRVLTSAGSNPSNCSTPVLSFLGNPKLFQVSKLRPKRKKKTVFRPTRWNFELPSFLLTTSVEVDIGNCGIVCDVHSTVQLTVWRPSNVV